MAKPSRARQQPIANSRQPRARLPSIDTTLPIVGPYDLGATLMVLTMGKGNPCLRHDDRRAQMTLDTPEGPVALAATHAGDVLRVLGEGPGAGWIEPHLAAIFGLTDRLDGFEPEGRLKRIADENRGLRLPRLPTLYARAVQVVLQQLITFRDACRGWRLLVQKHGEEFPGSGGLFYPPNAGTIGKLAVHQLMECDIAPKHARVILALSKQAAGLERLWDAGVDPDAVERVSRFLLGQAGIGQWTVGYLRGAGMGDADAVVLGDYGHPHHVAYFFTGEERGDDEQMVRLLEPYRPHRFRTLLLLIQGAKAPPRRGPRREPLRYRFR